MGKADALSRCSDYDRGEGDNADVVLLKPEMFIWAIEVEGLNLVWIKKIVENNDYDTLVLRAVQNKEKGWESTGRLHSWLGRMVVPRDQTLHAEIIQAHHNPPTLGHPGLYRTIEQIQRNWWWPGIRRDVQKYIDGCEECTLGSRPFPESNGYALIAIFVNRHSKQIHLVPTYENMTSKDMARLYRDNVFKLHGIPRKIVSDCGKQFESDFMRLLYSLLGIEPNYSTAWHPQTNGQAERLNQHVEQYLRLYVDYHQENWVEWLAIAEFTYNDRENASTGKTPFFINHGIHPYKGIEAP
ncbi:hypothetical protein AX16_001521 [Volvariella volvacea WC 439]|nr:hypothetical protein AX16_001521 [Volvariella volvacea WC 439]